MRVVVGLCIGLLAFTLPWAAGAADAPTPEDLAVPRYSHIFVIVDENKDFERIDGGADAPRLTRLARAYGDAVRFYGEVHPSEGNYVALVGGSTFGIHDDDAYFCSPGATDTWCHGADTPGYVAHTIKAPHLGTQLDAVKLTWKGYYQSIPSAGSGALLGSNLLEDGPNAPAYYASKHSGFINFASLQDKRTRVAHLVGFDALRTDVARGDLPNFGLIVPNLCDDMHGMEALGAPWDCRYENLSGLIARGDKMVGRLVDLLTGAPLWRSSENVAIVVTFDEDDGSGREGGGGHIATIVITNHGPRSVSDVTPYNHYSLLRTIEDAFGIHHYLGIAARSDQGVRPMLPLFRTTAPQHQRSIP